MYKAIKDSKIIAISEENYFPCLVYDKIQEDSGLCEDYIQVDGEFVLKTDDKAIELKKTRVRAFREQYFADYVDFYQSKPLYWEELDETLKQDIADYRNYLKDYTNGDNWWENLPKTLEEWRDGLGATA